ncbi:MAG: ATP-binding cassette domain-containing protein [Planctomycetota bacterium]
MKIISIQHLTQIFGKNKKAVLATLHEGKTQETIQQETGAVVSLYDISLEIQKGEIFVLMGLSGSGKSTLLRCINALNKPTQGEVLFHRGSETIEIQNASPELLREIRQKHISMVFQKYALMPWRTIRQNVAFGLEVAGKEKQEIQEIVDQKLELVGLKDWKDRYPHELSGGMQQRVGLARALATDADVLLLDEPFSALDPLTRFRMQEELLLLQKQLQKTMIFVSHDLDEALKLGSRIAMLEAGRLIQVGTPENIVTQPASEYVRNFVTNVNPKNVLRCETVLRPLEKLDRETSNRVWLDLSHHCLGVLDENQRLQEVWIHQNKGNFIPFDESISWDSVPEESLFSSFGDTLLKNAITVNRRTGYPLLILDAQKKLRGVVGPLEILNGFN